jgi:hypothetical protein
MLGNSVIELRNGDGAGQIRRKGVKILLISERSSRLSALSVLKDAISESRNAR